MCSHLCPKRAITGQMRAYLTNRDRERGGTLPACRLESRRGGSRRMQASGEPAYNACNIFNDCNSCKNFSRFFLFFHNPRPATRRLAHPGIRLFSLILAYSRLTAGKYLSLAGFQRRTDRGPWTVDCGGPCTIVTIVTTMF